MKKTVVFELDKRAFAYYNTDTRDWHVETGEFEILIGKSSRDIVLRDKIFVNSSAAVKRTVHRNTLGGDLLEDPVLGPVFKEFIIKVMQEDQTTQQKPDDSFHSMPLSALKYIPLRAMVNFRSYGFTEERMYELIKILNDKLDEQ